MSPPSGAARPPDGVAPLLTGLEPAQREAVLADDPVVCVLAGAGAGKTRVLTLRVARRIEDGSAHPTHVLVCTFSRKAADELRTRLWHLGARDGVTAGTFHRTALRLVGRHRADRGEPAPAVCDRRAVLAAMLRDEGGRGPGGDRLATRRRPGRSPEIARLDAEIGWAKARLVSPADYEGSAQRASRRSGMASERVAELYERYEGFRRRRGVMDLDDLLVHCGDLLDADPAFARAVRWWHRHLFVDEAQDMNEAQYRLVCLLTGDEPDLFAVGDPNQSVYGWNGADPGLLGRMTDEFAGTRVVRLDVNHRCTPQVVAAAAAVLDLRGAAAPVSTRADGPLPKVAALRTDAEEAAWIARQVWLAHRPGRRWSSIAVLARTNAQLEPIADALAAERVPHRIAGSELGPASDVSRTGEPLASAGLVQGGRAGGALGGAIGGALGGALDDAGGDAGVDAMDDAGTDDAGMDDADPSRPSPRHAPLEPPRMADRAVGPGDADDRDNDRVVLSTFHRAKGLQWPVVIVAGMADGTVPLVSARTRAARAEERRLLYVALTRAEDQLVCSWAQYKDELAVARGDAPRVPCPWLEPLERTVQELHQQQSASTADQVAEHLARIRQLLPSAAGGPGTTQEGP